MNDNLISLDGDRKFIGESMSLKTLKNKEMKEIHGNMSSLNTSDIIGAQVNKSRRRDVYERRK